MLNSSITFKVPPFARVQQSQRFCHAWKHPLKSLFGIVSSTRCVSYWISSVVSNLRPFIRSFSLGKRKKSQGARSGEYGGWGITVIFLAKNCESLKDLWAGALSWWILRFWFCHFCDLLRRTFSHSLLRTSQYTSALTVIPCGTNSRCTIPSWSKKQISIVFNLLFCILAFLGLGDPGLFHCEDCSFVSGS